MKGSRFKVRTSKGKNYRFEVQGLIPEKMKNRFKV